MASVTSRLRTRLDSLQKTVVNETSLNPHSAVPDDFLSVHNIRLIRHDFETTSDESTCLSCDPPILFSPLPESVIERHPIDPDECFSKLLGTSDLLTLGDYNPPGGNPETHRSYDNTCAERLFSYPGKWAIYGFPRKHMPQRVFGLYELSGIRPVYASERLLSQSEISGWAGGVNREAFVYEYRTNDDSTYYPHIIILSSHSEYGHDDSIMHSELIQLISAMRNRPCQPAVSQSEEDEEYKAYNKIESRKPSQFYYFRYEKKFPVLMVSCVAPQQARIYYACMAGSEVVVRQSSLYSF